VPTRVVIYETLEGANSNERGLMRLWKPRLRGIWAELLPTIGKPTSRSAQGILRCCCAGLRSQRVGQATGRKSDVRENHPARVAG